MIGGLRQLLQCLFSARRVAARAGRELDAVLILDSLAQRQAIERAHEEGRRAARLRETVDDVLTRLEERR